MTQEDTARLRRHDKARQGTRRHEKARARGHEGTGHEGTEYILLEDLALSKDRRPAEKVDFDKTLVLLPLKMLIFLPNKDFIPLPH